MYPCYNSSITGIDQSSDSRPAGSSSRPQRGGGRGWRSSSQWRGKGRGRGGGDTSRQGNGGEGEFVDRGKFEHAAHQAPRPTHFLSLPLGHHTELRDRVSVFQQGLLDHTPKVAGLDEKILVSPRRMHITLGVMTLADTSKQEGAHKGSTTGQQENSMSAKTRQSAIAFLNELRPRINKELTDKALRIGLKLMDILKAERGDPSKAHVMWAGPAYDNEDAKRLKRVAEFVHREFKNAGFIVEERPLKLHCTIINTSHRKGKRQPFSYTDIIASSAFHSIEQQASATPATGERRGKKPLAIDLGEWPVDEIQLCQMGSWGPEGEYVAISKISLP